MTIDELRNKYSEKQIKEACMALVDDYFSYKEFLRDFLRLNKDEDLVQYISDELFDLTEDTIDELTDEEINLLFDIALLDMCQQVDFSYVIDYLEKNFGKLTESVLTEAEEDDLKEIEQFADQDIEQDIEEEPEEQEDQSEQEDSEIEQPNDQVKKTVRFPVIIESEEDKEVEKETKDKYANQYGEAAVNNINDNKKFILSALDIYDFEIFYKNLDNNSYVSFSIILDTEVPNDQLMNIIKRYFDVQIDNYQEGDLTLQLNPVLDNKFIKIN